MSEAREEGEVGNSSSGFSECQSTYLADSALHLLRADAGCKSPT